MRRFSIRDLFWLTLVVALILGWTVNRERWREQLYAAEREKVAAGERGERWEKRTRMLIESARRVGWRVDIEPDFALQPPVDNATQPPGWLTGGS